MALTTLVIVGTALLEGVLFGLAAGVVLAAIRMSRTSVRRRFAGDTAEVMLAGNATFLRMPVIIEALEAAAASGHPRIRLDLSGVTHLDHACRQQIDEFVTQQREAGRRVEVAEHTSVPGPAVEWFHLDTRQVPESHLRRAEPAPRAGQARPEMHRRL